jgi:sugar lactone lactonase YvrE
MLKPVAPEFAVGVAFNAQGQMFLAYSDASIRTVMAGKDRPLRFASPGLNLASQGAGYLWRGMALGPDGDPYVTDGRGLFRIDRQGKTTRVMGGFEDAIDLKADPAGNLYVAEAQQGAVYKVTPDLVKIRLIDRGWRVRMREMLIGIAFDRQFQNLYLAERYTGQVLRYPLGADGRAGDPEVMARDIVSLRSMVVDDQGNIFANIDFPIILRIDARKQQRQFVIPNNLDFCMGRMAMGQAEGDRDTLYIPTKLGVVRISHAGGM